MISLLGFDRIDVSSSRCHLSEGAIIELNYFLPFLPGGRWMTSLSWVGAMLNGYHSGYGARMLYVNKNKRPSMMLSRLHSM